MFRQEYLRVLCVIAVNHYRIVGLVIFILIGALPVAAQFVNVTALPGNATSIVAARGNIYIGRDSFPTVLVYDSQSLQLLAEVSLLSLDTAFTPSGVTALGVTREGLVLVGSTPHGTVYGIDGLAASSLGRPPALDTAAKDTAISTTAIYTGSDGFTNFGFQGRIDTTPAVFFRGKVTTTVSGLARISLGEGVPMRILSIGGDNGYVGIATSDSSTGGPRGRLHLYRVSTNTVTTAFITDSAITAVLDGVDSLIVAGSPSGILRDSAGIATDTAPDTSINVLRLGSDGSETVIFVGGSTGILRKLTKTGLVAIGQPVVGLTSIIGLAYVAQPDRLYGVGRSAGGSFFFYYDSTAPTAEYIRFTLDTALRQPNTSDPFSPPLTSGRYFVSVRTNEKLSAIPLLSLQYADGSLQVVNLSGSNRDFSAEIVIDSSRVLGTVTIVFVGTDDAGNVGTMILAGSTFSLKAYGRMAVANNLIRPNLGEFSTVRYLLTSPQNVTIRIYNLRGQLVADLSPGSRGPGEYADVTWRGRNTGGNLVASGVYLLRFEAGSDLKATQKIMVVR